MSISSKTIVAEPYRLFFPMGTLLLLCGVLIWIPLLWTAEDYPILLHRFLVLNGFIASFVGGFLMTAVPKFSKTDPAKNYEVFIYLLILILGVIFAHKDMEIQTFIISALQPLWILKFLFSRISKRKENPPYSFVFIFVGLILWVLSAFGSAFLDIEAYKHLHYEGAIAAIILGVGSRLIPGILGHVEIVAAQRSHYETPKAILRTVPLSFFGLIFLFITSYFLSYPVSEILRAIIVLFIGLKFWKLYQLPKDKTALTFCIWISSWLIVGSFLLKAFWEEGGIHAGHAFFINGLVLLSLLIGTRVLVSHGPQVKKLEDWRGLYFITGVIFLASATRISAYLMPDSYLRHLGYASILLSLAVMIWANKYLRFILVSK